MKGTVRKELEIGLMRNKGLVIFLFRLLKINMQITLLMTITTIHHLMGMVVDSHLDIHNKSTMKIHNNAFVFPHFFLVNFFLILHHLFVF